jgi:beta-galactosidase GanA
MRFATYMAPTTSGKVEVAVTKFPGRVGGELANINRWRGQMGVATIDAAGLEAAIMRFSAAGFEGYETRIESAKGVMLAAGVYEQASDQTWFIRATAKDAAEADELKSAVFGMGRSAIEGKK